MRDSFVFYRSFYEAIRELPRDVQGEVYAAMMEYALNGECRTEQLKPVARSIFTLIKPQLDANISRFEAGRKGGAPKGNKNACKGDKQKQPTTEKQPRNNQKQPNENVNVNVNENHNARARDFSESESENPPNQFPLLSPIVIAELATHVCEWFEKLIASRANHGIYVDEIQQANYLYKLRQATSIPDEQIDILRYNIDGGTWKALCIPDVISKAIYERNKRELDIEKQAETENRDKQLVAKWRAEHNKPGE